MYTAVCVCRFRSSQSDAWRTLRVVPGDAYSLTVHGLRAGTRHEFAVLARDEQGAAHFSRVVNAMTTLSSKQPTRITDNQPVRALLGAFHRATLC